MHQILDSWLDFGCVLIVPLNVYLFFFCVATNPDFKKTRKIEHDFKVTSDGRLIIKEEDDDDDDDGSKGKTCS